MSMSKVLVYNNTILENGSQQQTSTIHSHNYVI